MVMSKLEGRVQDYGKEGISVFTCDNSGTEVYTMSPNEKHLHVDSALGACVVDLPAVAEAAGKYYHILKVGTGTNIITIAEAYTGESIVFANAGTMNDMDATGDRKVFYSDGESWYLFASAIA